MANTPPFKIAGIDHVVLRANDIAKMLAFYVDVLGCKLEKVQEQFGLYQLRAGHSLIDLIPVHGPLGKLGGAPPGKEGRNLDHLCLRIDLPVQQGRAAFDGEALRSYLIAKGAQPGMVESRYGAEGQGPSIYVSDPEGNVVELKGPPAAP
jgi:glyoxylase I family protein